MKTIRSAAVLAAVATLGLGIAASAATASPTATDAGGSTTASTLAFNREEERMARDLYAALAATYDQARPMSMITRSESGYFDSIGALLSTYGVADPSAGRAAGSYAFPELQTLSDRWLAKGRTSINAAYQVGVELERRDIADLRKAIAQTSEPDVLATYERLLSASQRHLAAYERAASGAMQTGTPGQGAMSGRGRGTGQGRGMGMNGRGGPGDRGAGQATRSGTCAMQT